MATRVERILSNARLTLADPNKERWDDQTLIAILNEAQIDFCQQTQMLHERINVPINAGDAYFDLPEDCWMLTRVLYNDSPLPLVSHKELDNLTMSRGVSNFGNSIAGSNWETTTGTPQAIVYDRRNMLQGKVYPIPKDSDVVENIYGVVSSNVSNLYGVTTAMEGFDVEPIYGVAVDLAVFLTCYYLKNPAEIADITTEIDIPSMYDIALKFYVVGQALMNDIDTAYQQKGAAQMAIYERHIQIAKSSSARDFTRAGQFHTEYNNGF